MWIMMCGCHKVFFFIYRHKNSKQIVSLCFHGDKSWREVPSQNAVWTAHAMYAHIVFSYWQWGADQFKSMALQNPSILHWSNVLCCTKALMHVCHNEAIIYTPNELHTFMWLTGKHFSLLETLMIFILSQKQRALLSTFEERRLINVFYHCANSPCSQVLSDL